MAKLLNVEYLDGRNENISEAGATATPEQQKPRILLIEKDSVVANDLALELEALGMWISGITNSLIGALKEIEEKDLDFALLSVELQDGVSYQVARRLMTLGVPFAFFTSFENDEIDPEFRHVPRLSKPLDTPAIADFVVSLTGTSVQSPALSLTAREKADGC